MSSVEPPKNDTLGTPILSFIREVVLSSEVKNAMERVNILGTGKVSIPMEVIPQWLAAAAPRGGGGQGGQPTPPLPNFALKPTHLHVQ